MHSGVRDEARARRRRFAQQRHRRRAIGGRFNPRAKLNRGGAELAHQAPANSGSSPPRCSKRMQIVAAADVHLADENLRERPTAGALDHLLALHRAPGCVDLLHVRALALQQRDGPRAVRAEGARVDGYLRPYPTQACQIEISIGLTTRARVTACTSAAPALRNARAHASKVAPVVKTSSTTRIVLPSKRPNALIAPPTFRRRSEAESPAWLLRLLTRLQRARFPGLAAGARHRLRQPGGLVEAPHRQPRPMHRRGRDEIRFRQRFAGGCGHPLREHRQPIAPSAALQIKDQPPRVILVDQRRPRGVVGRLPASARAADRRRDCRRPAAGNRSATQSGSARNLSSPQSSASITPGPVDDGVGQQRARRPDQVRQPRDHAAFPERPRRAIG